MTNEKVEASTPVEPIPDTKTEDIKTPIEKPPKPKRKCTEKQLAALAAGRLKNPRYIKHLDKKKNQEEQK